MGAWVHGPACLPPRPFRLPRGVCGADLEIHKEDTPMDVLLILILIGLILWATGHLIMH